MVEHEDADEADSTASSDNPGNDAGATERGTASSARSSGPAGYPGPMIDPKVTQAVTSQVQRVVADVTRESMSPLNDHARRQIANILQSNRLLTASSISPKLITGIPPAAQTQITSIARTASAASERIGQQIADLARSMAPSIYAPTIDLPTFDMSRLAPGFIEVLERFRRQLPPNWPSAPDLDRVMEIVSDDGLPLVWVPRAAIVQELLDVETRADRVAILVSHVPELLEDCRIVLDGMTDCDLAGQRQLAGRALDALERGHHEAAQALSVAVAETAISRSLRGKYDKVKKNVLFNPELVPYTELRLRAALVPVHRFYTEWNPKKPHPEPPPEELSRHVTVHQADPDHFTESNGVVAALLACSVLRALQEFQELAESSEWVRATRTSSPSVPQRSE